MRMGQGMGQRLLGATVGGAISLLLLSLPLSLLAVPARAANDAPDLEQPAVLISPRDNRPIPLFLRPAPNQPNVGYGFSGSVVTVLEQAGDYFGDADPKTTWNHIRLDDPPYTEGWVQGMFLSTPEIAPIAPPE
ncbi:MAG: hypothetical protein AAF766_05065 [Cyanobacteria bacterium P01_D01_bin.14]